MIDTNLYRVTPWRCSVLESENDPMNSSANPRIYPSRSISPGRDQSYPIISGSEFRDESFHDDSRARLQFLQISIDIHLANLDD